MGVLKEGKKKKKENKQQNTPTELPDAFFKISLIQIIITDCLGE